jgi:16S rRNA (guanine527-N7)-methyltransferase
MIASEDFSRLLSRHFCPVGSLTTEQTASLYGHYQLLELWNKKLNLTAIREAEDAVVRHYCESLFLGTLLPPVAVSVADIGSGAGFPGIPMSILRSDCRFALIESHRRKAVFLSEATRKCSNVQVLAERADEVKLGFDWAVCRAVKWEQALAPMIRMTGHVGFLTSEDEAAELTRAGGVNWQAPVRVPWGERRLAVLGSVSRETSI